MHQFIMAIFVGFFILIIAIIPAMVFQFRYRWIMCKIAGFLLLISLGSIPFINKPEAKTNTSQQTNTDITKNPPAPPKPAETKKQYIDSTVKIGNKQAAIYNKEFLKNPDKFINERINIVAEIFEIQEIEGKTIMQAYINKNYDSVIVYIPGSIPFYKDDLVVVYGEGGGSMVGQNRMGAEMQWPVIYAKYVDKYQQN